MIIDVVTIFPDYLAPLALSLPGKAIQAGLLDVRVHDLRRWTHDPHRTVDDTPYGGGAGMVMKPEPWGEALDELLAAGPAPVLLVMTPSGVPFTQEKAAELAGEQRLVFACGRYEGIDARVAEWARGRMRVAEISIGDYVLNGGEAAALVVIEAVARLIPGVIGNPASLAEESHTLGAERLLEYPGYTKPPLWRGLAVPDVLLSGDHARVAAWRRERAEELTRRRRPDLWSRPAFLRPLFPADFIPGDPPAADEFGFAPLTPSWHAEVAAAWREEADHIRATRGFGGDRAPRPGASMAEDAADLARFEAYRLAGAAYAWVAIDPSEGVLLGVAHVGPGRTPAEVELRSWVRGSHAGLDATLRGWVRTWLLATCPVARVRT